MKAYLFPGQGSQSLGMGANLFKEFPGLIARADQILGYSIARLCLEDPKQQLNQTQFTQPALFVVNALSYMQKMRDGTKNAAFFAGHSLGEYNALFAAGAFDFETGLKLVQKRSTLMAEAKNGGMAAVIGLDERVVRKVLEDEGLTEIDLANYNGVTQFILSGPQKTIIEAQNAFTDAGAKAYVPLRVSGAFHSRYMEPARREFDRFISDFKFNRLQAPVIANVTGQPYDQDKIANTLSDQLTHPVRWDLVVRYLLEQGDVDLEEVGPGTILTDLVAKIRQSNELLHRNERKDKVDTIEKSQPTVVPIAPVAKSADNTKADNTKDVYVKHSRQISPHLLGSEAFREAYHARYAYVIGSMYRGIASEQLVIRAARAGILAFFGTGGLSQKRIEEAIYQIRDELHEREPYGMNLVHNPSDEQIEENTIQLFLNYGIQNIEASAFMRVSQALVYYRAKGLKKDAKGGVEIRHKILAKVSRPEIAEAFLAPAPERIVRRLQEAGKITSEEAMLLSEIPMADDLCVEADSGGHTDQGNPVILLPTILRLRDRLMKKYAYKTKVRVGAAGGIGTPEAAASAFVMGADFILTGSINQCTVEAGISPRVKDMLEQVNIQDTDYAPAGDMFEMGAKVQVLKKGVFFPARAKKLFELYRQYESLDEIDAQTRSQIEQRYFKKSFDEVYQETRDYFLQKDPTELERSDRDPKYKMALVFRWYFAHSHRLAMEGGEGSHVDYQVHCGPALGAFNQWVKGTSLGNWKNRHIDDIAEMLMGATAEYLDKQFTLFWGKGA
jgi:trans-AT polyketide synthase/acyltransferase/oxidoreductase domain-containing protein